MAIDNKDKKVLKSSIEREQNELACSAEREKIKGSKNLNVPPLRFPEFTGEWQCKAIEKVAPLQRGFDLPTQNLVEGIYPVIYSNGILQHHDKYKCEAPGLITGRSGTIGKFTYIDSGFYWPHNTSLWVTDFCGNCPKFIYYLYQTVHIEQFSTGSGVPTLNRNDVHRYKTFVPTAIVEQEKIAKFLSILDERIVTQNKIIEDLKKLKSAIIDKSFCYPNEFSPQKRLTGFTEEWHLVHLSEICQRVRTKNFNSQCTLVLTIAAQFGLVSQEEFFSKSVASDNLEGYYLLQKGDFAYNKSYSGDYAWGAVKRLECFSEGVLSPLYICFRPDTTRIDSDFLAHYFESKKWYKGIADIAGEGARNHGLLNLSVIDYFKTLHRIPNLQEQKVIANVLNKLTSKISIEKKIYDNLLLQRQYLLQQMFI